MTNRNWGERVKWEVFTHALCWRLCIPVGVPFPCTTGTWHSPRSVGNMTSLLLSTTRCLLCLYRSSGTRLSSFTWDSCRCVCSGQKLGLLAEATFPMLSLQLWRWEKHHWTVVYLPVYVFHMRANNTNVIILNFITELSNSLNNM